MKKFTSLKSLFLVAMLAVGSVGVWGEEMTIIPDKATTGSNSGSYVETATAFNTQGIDFIINNWNPTTLQIRGNKSTNNNLQKGENFCFRNKSAFPGDINTVTLNYKSGVVSEKVHLQTGTTEITTQTIANSETSITGTNSITWTINNPCRFFAIGLEKGGTSGTANITSIVVSYTLASPNQVATPVFTPATGKYWDPVEVTLACETADAKIYYTTNGEEPTEASTEYTGAITVSTTTTLKAVAVKDGELSAVATATYTFPTEVADIAAFNATKKDDFVKITAPVAVTFVNGSYVYAQDASNGMLVYDATLAAVEGLGNGKTLTGLTGTRDEYNGTIQMASVVDYAISETEPVQPTTMESLAATDVNKYVKLENAKFDNTYSFTTEKTINGTLTTHGGITVRNNFRNFNLDVTPDAIYNIEGIVSVYKGAAQIYPISIESQTPVIYCETESLAFESVENGSEKPLEFLFSAESLAADVTLSISGDHASMFQVSPATVAKNTEGNIVETTVTVTYAPTATGEHTATLTMTSGDLTKTIALSGTGIAPILATPTATEATDITANSFTAHWDAVEYATSYVLNVWSDQEIMNEDFSSVTAGDNNTTTGSSSPWDGNENFTAVTAAYQAGGAIKLGTGSKAGSVTTKELELTGNNVIVSFGVKGWSSVEGDIKVTIGEESQTVTYEAVMEDEFETKSITFAKAQSNTVTIATTAKRAFIDNIVIMKSSTVVGSPFTFTGQSQEITGLNPTTTYSYSVVAKAENYTDSEKSNIINVTTLDEGPGTGIASVEVGGLYAADGAIYFNAVAGQRVEVINTLGQRVYTGTTVDGLNRIDVEAGIVVVKIDQAAGKVVVK